MSKHYVQQQSERFFETNGIKKNGKVVFKLRKVGDVSDTGHEIFFLERIIGERASQIFYVIYHSEKGHCTIVEGA